MLKVHVESDGRVDRDTALKALHGFARALVQYAPEAGVVVDLLAKSVETAQVHATLLGGTTIGDRNVDSGAVSNIEFGAPPLAAPNDPLNVAMRQAMETFAATKPVPPRSVHTVVPIGTAAPLRQQALPMLPAAQEFDPYMRLMMDAAAARQQADAAMWHLEQTEDDEE